MKKQTLLKMPRFLFLCIFAFAATVPVHGQVVVSDSFGTAASPRANLNGRTPETDTIGAGNWVAYHVVLDGFKTEAGQGLFFESGADLNNGMAGFNLTSGYFANNPGIYELSADVNLATTGQDNDNNWIGIGFSQDISSAGGNGFFQTDTNQGTPWMFLRTNGDLFVRDSGGNTIGQLTGQSIADRNLRLRLDTSAAAWTVDAYIDSTAIDLNGAAAGTTFTYSFNPTSIAAFGFSASTGTNTTGSFNEAEFDNFQLAIIPEPSTFLLLLGSLGVALVIGHRRNRG